MIFPDYNAVISTYQQKLSRNKLRVLRILLMFVSDTRNGQIMDLFVLFENSLAVSPTTCLSVYTCIFSGELNCKKRNRTCLHVKDTCLLNATHFI